MPVVGLGMDICSIDRIQRILDGPRAEKFLERVYTEAERALCSSRQDAAAAFAARFAAKEALLKALGAPSGVRWREIEVVPTSGAPELRLSGVAAGSSTRGSGGPKGDIDCNLDGERRGGPCRGSNAACAERAIFRSLRARKLRRGWFGRGSQACRSGQGGRGRA